MLKKPHVQVLAEQLKVCIDSAQLTHPTTEVGGISS